LANNTPHFVCAISLFLSMIAVLALSLFDVRRLGDPSPRFFTKLVLNFAVTNRMERQAMIKGTDGIG